MNKIKIKKNSTPTKKSIIKQLKIIVNDKRKSKEKPEENYP
jgi:hypothetical protein